MNNIAKLTTKLNGIEHLAKLSSKIKLNITNDVRRFMVQIEMVLILMNHSFINDLTKMLQKCIIFHVINLGSCFLNIRFILSIRM